jgi:transcriptional regulator with XRE-family HTH domain
MYHTMIEPAKILALRQSLGLTQAEFGSLVGVQAGTISRWEAGKCAPERFQAQLMVAVKAACNDNMGKSIVERLQLYGAMSALALALSHFDRKRFPQ